MDGNADWGPIDLLLPEAWLAALRDPACPLERCGCFLNPVPGSWATQPRVDPEYQVHYLFCAPRAALLLRLEDRQLELAPGTLAWFPPGVPYELAMRSKRSHEQLLRLRFQLLDQGRILSPFADARLVPTATSARDLAERLRGEWLLPRPHADEAVRQLLGQLSILALRVTPAGSPGRLAAEQVAAVAAYLAEHIERRPSPSELAAVLGLSSTHFTRVFTATVGCSPRSWLVRERIRHAAERLRTSNAPVAQVAAEFGYDNQFLFSRQFSAVMGRSPSAWRES